MGTSVCLTKCQKGTLWFWVTYTFYQLVWQSKFTVWQDWWPLKRAILWVWYIWELTINTLSLITYLCALVRISSICPCQFIYIPWRMDVIQDWSTITQWGSSRVKKTIHFNLVQDCCFYLIRSRKEKWTILCFIRVGLCSEQLNGERVGQRDSVLLSFQFHLQVFKIWNGWVVTLQTIIFLSWTACS